VSAAVAAGVASMTLGSAKTEQITVARDGALDAQASRTAYRYLAALHAHDWPGACTLVREQVRCIEALVASPPFLRSFDVVAARAAKGRAVASGTVNGIPVRIKLVREENQWLIDGVELSSAASRGPAPVDSTAPGA
jgi:hypothetical protein